MNTLVENSKSYTIPNPTNFDRGEVLQFFGLAAFYAQCLEGNLVWLATLLNLDTHLTEKTFLEGSFEHQKKTLGQLVRACENRVREFGGAEKRRADTGNTFFDDLREALEARNSLMHGFFTRHNENYITRVGRQAMLEELRSKCVLLKERNELVTGFVLSFSERLQNAVCGIE